MSSKCSVIAIPAPDWWNYKPIAKEIRIDCLRGSYIDIDFMYMLIQGADPMSERVIIGVEEYLWPRVHDKYKLRESYSQRGFLNHVIPTSEPLHGVYYRNMQAGMIRYIPHHSFLGIDCFRYVLANPWQTSDEYRVLINVTDGPHIRYYIHRKLSDPNSFKYSVTLIGLEPTYYYYVWYEQVPRVTEVGDRQEIVIFPVKLFDGVVEAKADGTFTVLDTMEETPWIQRYWPDPTIDGVAFEPGTDRIWRQPAGPFPFLVRCVAFDDVIVDGEGDYSPIDPVEMWADSMQGGEYWWFRGPSILWEP